jgi:hypothetical protein
MSLLQNYNFQINFPTPTLKAFPAEEARNTTETMNAADTAAAFSLKLRARLKEIEMKPYRLAVLSGLNIQHCYKIVRGDRSPSDGTLRKLSQVVSLGVSFEELKSWKVLSKLGSLRHILDVLPEEALLSEMLKRFENPDICHHRLKLLVEEKEETQTQQDELKRI